MVVLHCHQVALPGIEGIVFDKDGTLANGALFLEHLAKARVAACTEALAADCPERLKTRLLDLLGVKATGLDPDGQMAVGTRQENEQTIIMDLVNQGYLQEDVRLVVQEQFAAVDRQVVCKAAHTPPYEGTRAMLQRLRRSPLKLAVLSSDSPANVEEFLVHYSLVGFFDVWQGTEPGDPAKPDASLLLNLSARLGVPVNRTIVVGDSWADQVLADNAQAAGFIAVAGAWGRAPMAGAKLILQHWEALWVSC
jgi:phosphoglycolate phosphatase